MRRVDARWKLLLASAAAVVIVSEPRGELIPFICYWPLIVALALVARVDLGPWAKRCALVVPFLALASALPLVAGIAGPAPLAWAASIFLRGTAASALLALLAETTEFDELIVALQRLKLPAVWVSALALAFRYLFLLGDEWRRMADARACRAPALSGMALTKAMTAQLGLVFVRAWERGERVHGAMLVRGFDGRWPLRRSGADSPAGWLGCLLVFALFVGIRVAL